MAQLIQIRPLSDITFVGRYKVMLQLCKAMYRSYLGYSEQCCGPHFEDTLEGMQWGYTRMLLRLQGLSDEEETKETANTGV